MDPLVSVIIPTYNRAYTLRKAVDSVINQTFTNWELLVVDNSSQLVAFSILMGTIDDI